MRKLVFLAVIGSLLSIPTFASAKDTGAATILSVVLSGSGEWYNRDFKGEFPWGECILGEICCLVKISSAFDAAAGKTDKEIRLDFWSKPQ